MPLKIIGYKESTVAQELLMATTVYFGKGNISADVEIITPDEFMAIPDRTANRYALGFNKDQILRREITEVIHKEDLYCPTYIHSTVFAADTNFDSYIGDGTFIAPYCSLMINCKIGKYCLLENYCIVSHYTNIGDNVHMHVGTMIAGKTTIGNNCVFNFRSTVLNGISICDGVEVGAASTVTKDITVPGKYVGTPARRVGDKIDTF